MTRTIKTSVNQRKSLILNKNRNSKYKVSDSVTKVLTIKTLIQLLEVISKLIPANVCLLNVNNRNTSKRCEMCSKLTIKTLERRNIEEIQT